MPSAAEQKEWTVLSVSNREGGGGEGGAQRDWSRERKWCLWTKKFSIDLFLSHCYSVFTKTLSDRTLSRHVYYYSTDDSTYHTLCFPCTVIPAIVSKPRSRVWARQVDYVTMNQLFCNVITLWGNAHSTTNDHSNSEQPMTWQAEPNRSPALRIKMGHVTFFFFFKMKPISEPPVLPLSFCSAY